MGEKYDNCPVCSSSKLKVKYKNVKSDAKDVTFDIVECENCKLQFVLNKVSKEFLDNYNALDTYVSNYVYCDDNNNENLKFYYRKLKERITKRFKISGKILDIGCSAGCFLEIMSEDSSWDCYGVEISPKTVAIAKSKFGENIYEGSIETFEAEEGSFDVVSLQDSLDHMVNPKAVLEKCYRLLKKGGLLIVKAHNISCLYSKISGRNFYAIIPPCHLFYFNKSSISKLLEVCNFKLSWFGFIPNLLKIKTIFYRLARYNENSIFFKIYNFLDKTYIGNINIKKDLHDIFTVFAIKE